MRFKPPRTGLVAVVCAVLLCTGCSIFEPREAEPPDDSASPWQPPNLPTNVFQNMRTGLEDLTGVNYERSLHSSFTYVPDPQTEAVINDPSKWINYTDEVEKQVTQRIVSEASVLTVVFTNTPKSDTGQEAEFEGTYKLERTNQATGQVEIYEGIALYTLVRGSQGWQISRWEDREWLPDGNPSWGVLRGTLRQDT